MCLKIMGILNTTPDSFFDGGHFFGLDAALAQAEKMIRSGADIIDVGGESTRPPTKFHQTHGLVVEVSEEEEKRRVLPVLSELARRFPAVTLSVDTRRVSIAKAAIEKGTRMVNLVTEGVDADMAQLIADHPTASLVICHMRGKPHEMQTGDFHMGPMIPYLLEWFHSQIHVLKAKGVKDSQIILDPGIGFGKKKPDQDFEILRGLPELKALGYPLLVGLSRKSFMGAVLDKTASDLLPATLVMNTLCVAQGVDLIRVHDVAEHNEMRTLWERVKNSSLELDRKQGDPTGFLTSPPHTRPPYPPRH